MSDRLRCLIGRLVAVIVKGKSIRIWQLRLVAKQKNWTKLEFLTLGFLYEFPKNRKALLMLAKCMRHLNRVDESIKVEQLALSGRAAGWHPYFAAGLARKKLGQMNEACKLLRMAATKSPQKEYILSHLIQAIAAKDGMGAAAAEYVARSGRSNLSALIITAKIRDIREWARGSSVPLLQAGEEEEIPYETPHILGALPSLETHYVRCEKPCVAELVGARIFGQGGIILTNDGTALSETAGHPRFGRFVNLADNKLIVANREGQVLLNTIGFNTREIESGILLAGHASNEFGHFFPDFLPRLQFLRRHPDFDSLPIIVDEEMPQAHFDHLRRLAGNPLIRLKANESFVCGRLLMATSPSFIPVHFFPNDVPVREMPGLSPRALRFLRGKLDVSQSDGPRTGRWFLGRRNMRWRRLLNEDEIVNELAKAGFKTVYLEDMGMEEQILIFQRAEWIVAPNGSALLNLVFSSPGVKLLILSQPDLFNWGTFQGPMRSLGYNPVWLCGDNVTAVGQKHSDYQVPVDQVKEALQGMGLDEICYRDNL
jgi:hypothetical protein